MNPDHLRDYIITPTLIELKLYSEAAVNLLLLTAVQESRLQYLRQIQGPALGLWQMEPATYRDIWDNYLRFRPDLGTMVERYSSRQWRISTPPQEMVGNLPYACAMARIHYLRVPHALPGALDVRGHAEYWKNFYNSSKGKGSVDQFIRNAKGIELLGA